MVLPMSGRNARHGAPLGGMTRWSGLIFGLGGSAAARYLFDVQLSHCWLHEPLAGELVDPADLAV